MRYVISLLFIAFAVSGVASAQGSHNRRSWRAFSTTRSSITSSSQGKADEGRAFIRKHYRPADRAAGVEVLEFTPITGDWDWIAFFPVETDFLAWERPPMALRARTKFEEMVGGVENAKKLDNQFNDLIQELRIEIMARDLEK